MSTSPDPAANHRRRAARRKRVIVLACATTLLFASLFALQAFDIQRVLSPSTVSETLILYALSTINFTAFIVLLMVLVRNIIKLYRERQEMKLGARFKTRLVVFFVTLSLLPVIFLFFATRGLINRSIDKWFSLPAQELVRNALQIQESYVAGEQDELQRTANTLARLVDDEERAALDQVMHDELSNQNLLLLRLYDSSGEVVAGAALPEAERSSPGFDEAWERGLGLALSGAAFATQVREEHQNTILLLAAAPVSSVNHGQGGALVIAQKVSPDLAHRALEIARQNSRYEQLSKRRKEVRLNLILSLALTTLLVLFIATWMALYIARSIAEPVRQLAQATERIKRGDLTGRADIVGDDELAALACSFNEMAAELEDSRHRLEDTATELNERRRYIEAVLQSLSAGVISLDEQSRVTTINDAAQRLLRLNALPETGSALEALLPEEQREELRRMIRRAARARSVTREVHFKLANNVKLDAAVTVTSFHNPQAGSRGTVIVIEDLTELIEAQRRAAWSEVARRMAHEIKNPLTPIRLSAERLAKNLLGAVNGGVSPGGNGSHLPAQAGGWPGLDERGAKLVRECTTLIGAEVATLQRMVDEFSNFARLPAAKLALGSLNEVVAETLKLYEGRLEGTALEIEMAADLPPVLIDREQIKRVLVNLIDNALEAMAEGRGERRLSVATRELPERDSVEMAVADTGTGVAAADRERIFMPYFSTRRRGTGLGLAIVSHIVAEHNGRIRVEEHAPHGARLVIELPSAKEAE